MLFHSLKKKNHSYCSLQQGALQKQNNLGMGGGVVYPAPVKQFSKNFNLDWIFFHLTTLYLVPEQPSRAFVLPLYIVYFQLHCLNTEIYILKVKYST